MYPFPQSSKIINYKAQSIKLGSRESVDYKSTKRKFYKLFHLLEGEKLGISKYIHLILKKIL